ncbi:MAG: hypothetical protein PVI86_16785, partial [Phycisphaerae bacterium]
MVISMIAFLIALLLPSLKRSMALANNTVCMHNLREIGQAMMAYRVENDGWLPSAEEEQNPLQIQAVAEPDPWFVKLFPTYLNDPLILGCPADPYKFRLVKMHSRLRGPELADSSSYGINSFITQAGDGYLAQIDRHQPSRPHETILLADMGPDEYVNQKQVRIDGEIQLLRGPERNAGYMSWDDGFDPFAQEPNLPWLTKRHGRGINVLTLAGGVRSANTADLIDRPIERFYSAGAA